MTKKQYNTRKRRRRHGEQVEGHDGLPVVVKKCEPLLGRITPAVNPPQVAGDGPLGEHEAELLQFAMDFRGAPVGVLLRQPPNHDTNFLGDPRPAATPPRFSMLIKPKSSPIPTDDRFRLDNEKRLLPARPGRPQDRPE